MSLIELVAILLRFVLFGLVLFGLVRTLLFFLTRGKEKQKKQLIKEKTLEHQKSRWKSFLLLRVLKTQSRGPEFTEQFLISLHSLFKTFAPTDALKGIAYQDVLSLEMIHKGGNILFVLQCYSDRVDFLTSQIYSQYPDIDIEETTKDPLDDYKRFSFVTAVEFCLTRLIAPIRLLWDTGGGRDVHPFTSFLSPLSRLDMHKEGMIVQCLLEPVGNDWHAEGQTLIQKIREGKFEEVAAGAKPSWFVLAWNVVMFPFIVVFRTIYKLFSKQSTPAETPAGEEKKEDISLSEREKILMNAYQAKILSFGFAVTVRVAYFTSDESRLAKAESRFLTMMSAWKPHEFFGSHFFLKRLERVLPATWFQKILKQEKKVPLSSEELWTLIQQRTMSDKNRMILNTKEISSLFHLPYTAMTIPNIAFASYRRLQPPVDIPVPWNAKQEIVLIGRTNYRNEHKLFGIQKDDRRRHMYVIGKTGMGKSTFLSNMIYDDIQNGRGVCVIDPHGDLANDALIAVPESRIQDVVYVYPADYEFPVSFNMFDVGDDPQKKFMAASGIVTTLKKLFGTSWGPRLEYILRNTCIALMDTPWSTFLSILRMYNEEYFRNMVVANTKDEVVKSFWINEFGRYDQKQIIENVGSIQNKVWQFLSNAIIRNLICQQKNTINIRQFMDEGKIVIINLSKGLIGDDNAELLGSMLITKIQIDAMSRADTEEADRRDFYLYVDEFQNFATDSFATILSEARKYKLSLCMANQYVRQMPDTVRDAVFGNVGTLITHQVGVDDAPEFVKAYSNTISESDLLEIAKYKYYTRMLIDGMPSVPFSADALPPPRENKRPEVIAAAIEHSRSLYAKPRLQVEADIVAWSKDFIDPRKIEKEKEAMDKKAAYEARKAQLIAEGKWDPEGRKKEQQAAQTAAAPARKYPPRKPAYSDNR